MEGLLPAGAGDAAGAAPGRALSTPCKLTKGQVSLERKCYRPRGRARQGRAGQGRASEEHKWKGLTTASAFWRTIVQM